MDSKIFCLPEFAILLYNALLRYTAHSQRNDQLMAEAHKAWPSHANDTVLRTTDADNLWRRSSNEQPLIELNFSMSFALSEQRVVPCGTRRECLAQCRKAGSCLGGAGWGEGEASAQQHPSTALCAAMILRHRPQRTCHSSRLSAVCRICCATLSLTYLDMEIPLYRLSLQRQVCQVLNPP